MARIQIILSKWLGISYTYSNSSVSFQGQETKPGPLLHGAIFEPCGSQWAGVSHVVVEEGLSMDHLVALQWTELKYGKALLLEWQPDFDPVEEGGKIGKSHT